MLSHSATKHEGAFSTITISQSERKPQLEPTLESVSSFQTKEKAAAVAALDDTLFTAFCLTAELFSSLKISRSLVASTDAAAAVFNFYTGNFVWANHFYIVFKVLGFFKMGAFSGFISCCFTIVVCAVIGQSLASSLFFAITKA